MKEAASWYPDGCIAIEDEGLSLVTDSFILQNEVLTCQLALTSDVVPKPDGRVITTAGRDNGPLDGDIKACDRAIVEASADQIELDFVVQVVALPNRLDVDDTYVVVLHGDGQRLFIAVQCHAKYLLALRRGWLPSLLEVIVGLA